MIFLMTVMASLSLTGAPADDTFQPTADEQVRLELMQNPQVWFEQNLAGPREHVDGQWLDPKMQHHLEMLRMQSSDEAAAALEIFRTAEGRALAREALSREWALLSKITAPMAKVENGLVVSTERQIPIRIYTPQTKETGPLPALVYFHGGGWLYSSIDSVDRAVRLIANEAQVVVISADYALAPEHPWPAASDDGETVYKWVRENAAALNVASEMIGVGGDSAGGHVAINIGQRMTAQGYVPPTLQLLYYPATDLLGNYESSRLFGRGYDLDDAFVQFALPLVFPGGLDEMNPQVLPGRAPNLSNTPTTIIASAGFDILRDPVAAYAARLQKAGVAVTYLNYPSLYHGFMQWSGVVDDADRACTETARLCGTQIRSRRIVQPFLK
jgi:acetyl esterase/lipase